jgi:predicted nucleotidyltransferase
MTFKWPKFGVNFDVEKHTILMGLAGSRSYGTDHPDSDTDYRGILVPPREYYMSPFKNFEQTGWKGDGVTGRVSPVAGEIEADVEGTIFGIQKFVKLAANCNPNVIEGLFVDEQHLVVLTEEGQMLRDNREIFLSQNALKTFTGYGMSQLKKIRTHKQWLDNPPTHRPTREEFDLPKEKLIKGEQMGAARTFITRNTRAIAPWLLEADNQHAGAFYEGLAGLLSVAAEEAGMTFDEDFENWIEIEDYAKGAVASNLGLDSNFVQYLQREKQHAQAVQRYKQYESWKVNRNPARAELEARYGYDCKHAMHLVRLLRMGEEILTEGKLIVYRPDREELKEIRNGAWAYEKLIEWADERVDHLYDVVRSGKSAVPKKPDQNAIEKLVIEVQDRLWSRV